MSLPTQIGKERILHTQIGRILLLHRMVRPSFCLHKKVGESLHTITQMCRNPLNSLL